jgi:thioredoxin-like negative regulator of GroEL
MLATTSQKLDPFNAQIENLIFELKKIKAQQATGLPALPPQAQLSTLEQQFNADPKNTQIGIQLASAYLQGQQNAKVAEVVDQIMNSPTADASAFTFAANIYAQLGQITKVEQALVGLIRVAPTNPEGRYDLAAVQALLNKTTEAMQTLRTALEQNSQRLVKDPNAPNLLSNVLTDARFASLRTLPDYNKMLETFKSK